MRAVRFDGTNVVLDTNAADPAPGPGEALVRVHSASPDATDLAIVRQEASFTGTLGRRFVGEVLQPGDDQRHQLLKGTRVVADINLPDPTSELARRGLGRHDPDRRVLGLTGADGCLADQLVVPATALVAVPEELTDDQAVFAVPMGDAVHTARLLRLDAKSYVTVLGESVEALLTAQVMARENHTVRLLSRDPDRLELCERWGVRRRHTDEVGRRADQDVVLVADALPESLDLALGLVRPRGTIVVRSGVLPTARRDSKDAVGFDLHAVIEREITVIGARCGPARVGLQTIAGGGVDLSGLISARFAMDDAVAALRALAEPGTLAVVVDVNPR